MVFVPQVPLNNVALWDGNLIQLPDFQEWQTDGSACIVVSFRLLHDKMSECKMSLVVRDDDTVMEEWFIKRKHVHDQRDTFVPDEGKYTAVPYVLHVTKILSSSYDHMTLVTRDADEILLRLDTCRLCPAGRMPRDLEIHHMHTLSHSTSSLEKDESTFSHVLHFAIAWSPESRFRRSVPDTSRSVTQFPDSFAFKGCLPRIAIGMSAILRYIGWLAVGPLFETRGCRVFLLAEASTRQNPARIRLYAYACAGKWDRLTGNCNIKRKGVWR